jgi:hypothetical protein
LEEFENRKKSGEIIAFNLEDIRHFYLRDVRKSTQKFKTVKDDNNFFVDEIIDSVQGHSQVIDTTSKQRIRNAKELFQKCFADQPTAKLEKWCGLIENATITEYVVKNKTQATQVFAFQNDRETFEPGDH